MIFCIEQKRKNMIIHFGWLLKILLIFFWDYSLITKHGICRHIHGENAICKKSSVHSRNSCEESCTSFEGCIGYSFSSLYGICELYPSDISDNQSSCPSDKGFVQHGSYNSKSLKSMNEMVPFWGYNSFNSYHDYSCYKKDSGKSINSLDSSW